MVWSRSGRRSLGALAAVGAAVLAPLIGLHGTGASSAAAGEANEEPTPQTDAAVPARDVTMIGASPLEAPGETWGVGQENGGSVIVRYTAESGWSLAPGPLDAHGGPLTGFKLAHPEGFKYPDPSPLAGQTTPNGSGVLLGTVPEAAGPAGSVQQVVLVREPGGAFEETAPVPAGLLTAGESLFGLNRTPLLAALEEASGKAGALIVPVNEGGNVEEGVLHWDGTSWSREAIEPPEPLRKEKAEGRQVEFSVVAIGASAPGNAWLLARLSPAGNVVLFNRRPGTGGEAPTWRAVALKPGGEPGEPLTVEGRPFTVPTSIQSQILTVTSAGVWVDGERRDVGASSTMLFRPEGEASGEIVAAWCAIPPGAPAGTPSCAHELPEALPSGPSRSFAWANASTPEGFGERVITGFADGVSLRLDGTAFVRVPALGGSPPPRDVGGTFGAAFSSAKEGWLGQELLPVHLTLKPFPSLFTPWPTAFRYALVALAPEPEQPVGSLSSEALAVGDQGEVARYKPGEGWLPESLLGAGGRRETPRLRAVAWPTPNRAYAVGDSGESPQMWLWRGETGLWEPDPATPLNFRGNLLGIAFDPSEPARGYAVGQQGVLLRYGKTWTQEATCQSGVAQPCLPPEVAGASFTSIAFAGSEAIVAYRKLPSVSQNRYEGGLIVNDGTGWQIDQGAATAMGANVPWAVAGLPDGGAAFTASGSGEGAGVYERQSAGAEWQATPVRYPPGASRPGSLTLFREGGALRAIVAGSEPETFKIESEAIPAPGFPPPLIPPYPLPSDPEAGVLRQTATGWSDEEHELNDVKEPPGEYAEYDTVYQPDPVAAVLVDPTGSQGWAVGGLVDERHRLLDTADVYRYPADGVTPTGVGSAPVSAEPGFEAKAVGFAIGGGAQCAAPCADLARARIGPDTWLSSAVARAGEIAGVRAFIDTGSRVTTGQTAGPEMLPIPYRREQERYGEVLRSGPEPAYAAASPTDLDETRSEGAFTSTFAIPPPFGAGCEATVAGCQAAYYALPASVSDGVLVLVLDDTAPAGPQQLAWLAEQLGKAKAAGEPAIVVGHADLAAQIAAGEPAAGKVAEALVAGGASAYFFDSPEQNVELPLRTAAGEITSYGSGTLGYNSYIHEEEGGFIGASGFMLAQVDVAARNPTSNIAPVKVWLIPDIGELAIEAEDGTLLRRSESAQFDALARRPRSGNRASNLSNEHDTSPYIPIPANCVGLACAHGLLPKYTFTSSKPDIGNFVEPNLVSGEANAVELDSKDEPIEDPESGLFCAYNAGTTIVTIHAGGLAYSLPVTVQAGSPRQPCGTVPLTELPSHPQPAPVPPPPAPAPTPAPTPASAPPPVPLPPPPPPAAAVAPRPPAPPRTPPPPPFFLAPPSPFLVVAFVPPPLPPPANPTPPSGTSAVTSPVEAAQREEEQESAPESVSNQAMAYRTPEHEPSPAYVLGVVLLAAFAGASLRGRPGRRGRTVEVAPATIAGLRSQRRVAARRGRPR
jgi:hypothetical protein